MIEAVTQKLECARQQTEELEKLFSSIRMKDYFSAKIIREGPVEYLVAFEQNAPLPNLSETKIGGAIHYIRSAVDAAYTNVMCDLLDLESPKRVQLKVKQVRNDAINSLTGKHGILLGHDTLAQGIVDAIKPYRKNNENSLLVRLNDLSNADKHDGKLLPIIIATSVNVLGITIRDENNNHLSIGELSFDLTKNRRFNLARFTSNIREASMKSAKVASQITFCEDSPAPLLPVIQTLKELESYATQFEGVLKKAILENK